MSAASASASPGPGPGPGPSSPAKHRRSYQACVECRASKVKCDLGDVDRPRDPPCRRCSRTGRQCVIVGSYNRKPQPNDKGAFHATTTSRSITPNGHDNGSGHGSRGRGKGRTGHDIARPAVRAGGDGMDRLERVYPSPPVYTNSRHPSPRPAPAPLRQAELENPGDAVRILAATASDAVPVDMRGRERAPGRLCGWSDWSPVQEGLISPVDAGALFSLYYHHLHPCYPLLPAQLVEPSELSTLIAREPILLGAIVCIAARYRHLVDPAAGRADDIHGNLFKWLMMRVAYLTCGDPALQSLASVEGLLLLAEWPPLSHLLSETSSAGGPRQTDLLESSRMYDHFSWSMIGMAVRLAQDMSLHKEDTYYRLAETDEAVWKARRRFSVWIYCHEADRHVSVRLGRDVMVQPKMSTRWWEVVERMQRKPGDTTFPFPRVKAEYAEHRAYAELAHTLGVMQEALYSSPEATSDLLRTGRIDPLLRRLKPELDSLWAWHCSIAEINEFSALRLKLEFDYVRLYCNAISIRSAQHRVLRRLMTLGPSRPVFDLNVIRSVEAPLILEAIDSAESLLRGCLRMHELGVLSYCPSRVFLRITFASVFLVKALTMGALEQNETEMTALQNQVVDVMARSAVDADHICGRLAGLLRQLLRTTPAISSAVDESKRESAWERTRRVSSFANGNGGAGVGVGMGMGMADAGAGAGGGGRAMNAEPPGWPLEIHVDTAPYDSAREPRRSAMGGAQMHSVHAVRSGDGRYSGSYVPGMDADHSGIGQGKNGNGSGNGNGTGGNGTHTETGMVNNVNTDPPIVSAGGIPNLLGPNALHTISTLGDTRDARDTRDTPNTRDARDTMHPHLRTFNPIDGAIPTMPNPHLTRFAADMAATSGEQDQLLSDFFGPSTSMGYGYMDGDGGGGGGGGMQYASSNHLLGTLWNHDVFDEFNDFMGSAGMGVERRG